MGLPQTTPLPPSVSGPPSEREIIAQILWALSDFRKDRPCAYKLDLSLEATIHPVFHVSQLKQAMRSNDYVESSPPMLTENFEWIAKPEDVMAYRTNEITNGWELLVQWKGFPEHEGTWESLEQFHQQFPDFPHNSHVCSKG